MTEIITRIPLDQLQPSPSNRRVGGFDPVKLQQLADSIKADGVHVPAIVRPLDEGYEIVAGERRWRASKLAGVEDLPCVVRKLSEAEVIKIRAVENVQREDVHPLDEAESYQTLIDHCGYDVEAVASELGKSASYVYQRLKLKDLIPKARELFVEGRITAGHAILVARLGPAQQAEVVKDGLRMWNKDDEPVSVRDLDGYIRRMVLLELSGATWKLADDTLTRAGSCAACAKRTGAAPELFADVGKKDHCTDRACFSSKSEAIVGRRKAELADAPHLEVSCGYGRKEKPEGVLESHEWAECKKSEPGALRVLVVDGPKAGQLTYGKAKGKGGAAKAAELDPKVKAERAKAKKLEAARKELLLEIYAEISAAAETRIKVRKEGDDILGLRRVMTLVIWDRLGFDAQRFVATLEGWPKPEPQKNTGSISWDPYVKDLVGTLDARGLDLFTLTLTFAGFARVFPNSYYRIPRRYEAVAEFLDVDIEAMIEAKLKDAGIKRKDFIDPVPAYARDEL